MDRLPIVERCCCGLLPLRTGTLVIGYIQLVFAVFGMIGYSVGSGAAHAGTNIPSGSQGMGITLSIFFAIHIIITVLLLVGTHKDRSGFVYVWLIFNAICVVVGIVLFIVAAVFAGSLSGVISTLITGIIDTVVMVYFIIVVNSYYNSVKGNTSHPLSQA